MNKNSIKTTTVILAAVFLFAHSAQFTLAHPGHGHTPDLSSDDNDCGRCGENGDADESSQDQPDREGNTGDGPATRSENLIADADYILSKTQTLQSKLTKVGTRASKSHEVFKETGAITASSRRQVLRSLRSARRSSHRLARELARFIEQYSDGFSEGLRGQLKADMVSLNTQIKFMSEQEASLSGTGRCVNVSCIEVIEMLDQQEYRSANGMNVQKLTQTLTSLIAGEDRVEGLSQ